MPVLGKCFGKLHPHAVNFQVITVLVVGKQRVSKISNGLPHGDQLEWQDVNCVRVNEVGNVEEASALLSREGETRANRGVESWRL